jgi:hypothetical protein
VARVRVFFSRIAQADEGKDLLFACADITHNSVNSERCTDKNSPNTGERILW